MVVFDILHQMHGDRVWDADDEKDQEVMVMEGHTDLVRSAALSPDNKTVVSGSNDKAIW